MFTFVTTPMRLLTQSLSAMRKASIMGSPASMTPLPLRSIHRCTVTCSPLVRPVMLKVMTPVYVLLTAAGVTVKVCCAKAPHAPPSQSVNARSPKDSLPVFIVLSDYEPGRASAERLRSHYSRTGHRQPVGRLLATRRQSKSKSDTILITSFGGETRDKVRFGSLTTRRSPSFVLACNASAAV